MKPPGTPHRALIELPAPSVLAEQTISILGCGWLGRALGEALVADGCRVRGSTTTPEKRAALQAAGIAPFLLRLAPALEGDAGDFFASEVLVLNVPPSRSGDDPARFHRAQVRAVADAADAGGVQHLLFVSSTGVYPALGREVTEDDAPDDWRSAGLKRATARAVLAAEHLLRERNAEDGFDLTIVRAAGLYGPDRNPGRFLAGKEGLEEGGRPVNFVHRDDVIGVLRAVLAQDAFGEVFNACADRHPARRAFFREKARALGLASPTFADDEKGAFKIVSNEKVKRRLGYRFRHPDPLAS